MKPNIHAVMQKHKVQRFNLERIGLHSYRLTSNLVVIAPDFLNDLKLALIDSVAFEFVYEREDDKYGRLKVGPEMDAFIAKEIMKRDIESKAEHSWRLDDDGSVDIFGFSSGNCNGPSCSVCSFGYCHHCTQELDNEDKICKAYIPSYSEDLSCAWQVLESYLGPSWRLSQSDPTAYEPAQRWWCILPERYGGDGVTHFGHTVSEAICKAAIYEFQKNATKGGARLSSNKQEPKTKGVSNEC